MPCLFAWRDDFKRTNWDLFTVKESKMTWTPLIEGEEYNLDGSVNVTATDQSCRLNDAELLIFNEEVINGFNPLIKMSKSKDAELPNLQHDVFGGYTVRLCYCGNYNRNGDGVDAGGKACDETPEFVQSFGKLYIWRMNICDYGNAETDCMASPYLRVVPHQKFVIQITCPPGGGCVATNSSRIGFLAGGDGYPNNDKPAWFTKSSCAQRVEDVHSAKYPASINRKELAGGTRVDYKIWQDVQVQMDIPSGGKVDVCYCNGIEVCMEKSNWFRIGHVIGANFNLASKGGNTGTTLAAFKIAQFAGKPGILGFYGGIKTPANINGLTPKAVIFPAWADSPRYSGDGRIKVLPYNNGLMKLAEGGTMTYELAKAERTRYYFSDKESTASMDVFCLAGANADPDLISEFPIANAPGNYTLQHQKTTVSNYHTFLHKNATTVAGAVPKEVTFQKSGIVALCYCGILQTAAPPKYD